MFGERASSAQKILKAAILRWATGKQMGHRQTSKLEKSLFMCILCLSVFRGRIQI